MKLYSVKSSAVRAAKAAGLTQYEIIEQDGQFGFRPVKAKKAKRNVPNESEALEQYERELDEAQNPETVETPAKAKAKKPAAKSKRAPAKKAAPTVASASTIESPVRRVWEIADSMPDAKRKDVVDACIAQGINFFTARTQYQKWRQNQAT